jgi:Flp pilus assembly protein TadG
MSMGDQHRVYSIIAGNMNTTYMSDRLNKTLFHHHPGQSMVEFALILPLFVLFLVGVFELGRAFFSYIAITNAAREGTRVVTFWPGKTTVQNVLTAVKKEIGTSPMVDVSKIDSIEIKCGNPMTIVTTDAALKACPSDKPVRVTVTYQFEPILSFFFPQPLMLVRSAEMMVP